MFRLLMDRNDKQPKQSHKNKQYNNSDHNEIFQLWTGIPIEQNYILITTIMATEQIEIIIITFNECWLYQKVVLLEQQFYNK